MYLFKKYFCASTDRKPTICLQNIIKPLYIATSLLGLFPYSVRFVKSKNRYVIIRKSVYVNSLCGITVCLQIIFFTGLHIREILLSKENINLTEAVVTQMNYVLELLTLVTFCIVTYICIFLNRTKYVVMLNKIISTWHNLPTDENNQHILKYVQFQVNVVCGGTLIVILVLQMCVNFTRTNSYWKMILVTFTFNFPQMVQFLILSFYYMLVMMIAALLMNIEVHCRQLLRDNMNAMNGVRQVQNKPLLKLEQLKLTYVNAFEIKCTLNEVFQGPILITALQCFHSIVSEAHIIYHGLVVQKSITTHEILNCSIWIIYQILKIYSLAYSGNLLKLQALKIGQILHSMPNEKRDIRWLMEIQHFSSLMYYQDIELNVYGYFPLNATFVYNMMASATMYLIILVQFDKLE